MLVLAVNVAVVNDSSIRVSFNQEGNWWWYEGHGAQSYETGEFKVQMVPDNNQYLLTIKHPKENYIVLYETDGMWRVLKW